LEGTAGLPSKSKEALRNEQTFYIPTHSHRLSNDQINLYWLKVGMVKCCGWIYELTNFKMVLGSI